MLAGVERMILFFHILHVNYTNAITSRCIAYVCVKAVYSIKILMVGLSYLMPLCNMLQVHAAVWFITQYGSTGYIGMALVFHH